MLNAVRHLSLGIKKKSLKDRELITAIHNIVGCSPRNLALFKLAITHKSASSSNKDGFRESNERLEYLGDAILSAVVADFLFAKYPFKDEGFLTEIRSRIVSRDSLNNIGKKLGIPKLIEYDNGSKKTVFKSVFGNALEAIIGAVYLDRGYPFCKKFIIQKLIVPHFDLQDVIKVSINHKSKLIEWCQQKNAVIHFSVKEINDVNKMKEFEATVFIDDEKIGEGYGNNKKRAEQDAALKTLQILNIPL
ncbi:MAG: ribonuclease III [Cyclobacteriaceae bacterium]|nr:ribonuclease III [Cyclobacteriaceae bacterium]